MTRAIQIRGVPDDVHDALVRAAAEHDMSLTRYLQGELRRVAGAAEVARHNARVVRRTRKRIGVTVDREAILAAIHDGRQE